jgi:hypothetical protein
MPKFAILFAVNLVFLIWNILMISGSFPIRTYAQRPPEGDPFGVPFLKVNINPTDVPPFVNINPDQYVPRVEVTNFPELKLAPSICSEQGNFLTGIGNSISGPLVVTYLNLREEVMVTLVSGQGPGQSMNLGSSTPLSSAIYLEAGQRLEFDTGVMYSGCRP